MGTTYTVKVVGESSNPNEIKAQIDEYLINFNQVFSTYISNSEISLINNYSLDSDFRENGIEVSDAFKVVFSRAYSIYRASGGNFDPTVYPLVKLWKVALRGDGSYEGSGNDKADTSAVLLPSDEEINAARSRVGLNKTRIEGDTLYLDDITLDFSAIAKGSAVDGVAALLEVAGYRGYMVEIGGEVRVSGLNGHGQPWKILISPPAPTLSNDTNENNYFETEEAKEVILAITNVAVATSGDYLNYFVHEGEKYSHLFNPLTGHPIKHKITSVSVVLPDCESADAWATALIVMGEEGIAFSERKKIPAIFMRIADNGNIEIIRNSLIDKYLN